MGKRKSSKVIKKVKREVVAKIFDCPFCNHERSVECKFDKIAETAMLFCRMCKVTYLTTINNLTEPIDVFSEWIDKVRGRRAALRSLAAALLSVAGLASAPHAVRDCLAATVRRGQRRRHKGQKQAAEDLERRGGASAGASAR